MPIGGSEQIPSTIPFAEKRARLLKDRPGTDGIRVGVFGLSSSRSESHLRSFDAILAEARQAGYQ